MVLYLQTNTNMLDKDITIKDCIYIAQLVDFGILCGSGMPHGAACDFSDLCVTFRVPAILSSPERYVGILSVGYHLFLLLNLTLPQGCQYSEKKIFQ